MIRTLIAAALLTAASPLAGQTLPPFDKVAALRDAANEGDRYAWDIVEGLTTEVGPRLAGTEAEARARDWSVRKLTAMGFANVRVERFDMPVWTRGRESAEILSPFPQPLVVAALGNSASTGLDGVSGEIAAFDTIDALSAAPDSAVRGKIVFVDHRMAPTQDGSSYGASIGPRLAGTEAEARARDWSVKKLTAMGFANVRVERFDMPVWTRGRESVEIVSAFPQPLVVAALGNSASTGPDGVSGEIAAFDTIDALSAAPDSAVRGKIVFVDHRMAPTQDGSSYGASIGPRSRGPTLASKKGALAIVIRSIGTDHHRNPHTGVMTFADGAKPIPAGALSVPDAEQLARILKRGQPVRMKLVLESRTVPGQSGNVIAEVPGRDPSLAPVLVSGHLDSWDQGTGAVDDGAGVAIAAAAAKRIMDSGRPLRTIRIVWFGAEEVGLFGGNDYRARHGKEPHYALIESDFGADRIWKVDSKLGEARKGEAEAIGKALAPLGIVTGSFSVANGSDIGPMLADGHPGVGLNQDGTRYFDLHHTPDDTLDKVDPAQLRQNVAAWTAVLAILSGGIEEPKARKRR